MLKTAYITGASAGLGAEFARQLAARGYNLVLVARRLERLETLAAELRQKHNVQAEALAADLANGADVARLAERLAADKDLALLVNNAGFGLGGPFVDSDVERQLEMLEVHVSATMRLTRAALPGMLARRSGNII
ncbi:MAG: SDR family NAD(P)-dependent oxidoreductase, partial [Anaerolineales bacterium]|nr:SDR family NAD(P)-dependent oxidoreductase [Anaerolineales bacterium]